METTLNKIEQLGKKNIIKNYAERIRTDNLEELIQSVRTQADTGEGKFLKTTKNTPNKGL